MSAALDQDEEGRVATTAFDELIEGMAAGRGWSLMGDTDAVRGLMDRVYDERFNSQAHYRERFQKRVNLPKKDDNASYAGWITSENPTSGPYQGTSFVWMPAEQGSVAVLVIGTDGFGADTAILGRPGHGRRLRALSRLHRGALWVKPDLLDIGQPVPTPTTEHWPDISKALKSYSRHIYAAVTVRSQTDTEAVADLLDLFFSEHGIPVTGAAGKRWEQRLTAMSGAVFPALDAAEVLRLLRERRFVVLEGPPGTGKTRLAYQLAEQVGSSTNVQFHAARTYEDFVVGLYPKPTAGGLAFEVRPGDLLVANAKAREGEHLLVLDEINRADLARVLGEAVVLFEVGESERSVRLPHTPEGEGSELQLSRDLLVLGTRNTADRSIARMDVAIRRRFAFVPMWPDLDAVEQQGVPLAIDLFQDVVHTFTEYADDETLQLIPGHAYFLDPWGDQAPEGREARVARRLRFELLPLLRDYLAERLCGGASEAIAALADRVEARLQQVGGSGL